MRVASVVRADIPTAVCILHLIITNANPKRRLKRAIKSLPEDSSNFRSFQFSSSSLLDTLQASKSAPPTKARESTPGHSRGRALARKRNIRGRCCTRREKFSLISLALGKFIALSPKAPNKFPGERGMSSTGGGMSAGLAPRISTVSLPVKPPACSGTFALERRHQPREKERGRERESERKISAGDNHGCLARDRGRGGRVARVSRKTSGCATSESAFSSVVHRACAIDSIGVKEADACARMRLAISELLLDTGEPSDGSDEEPTFAIGIARAYGLIFLSFTVACIHPRACRDKREAPTRHGRE